MNERTRIILLIAGVVLVYGNTLLNSFTYDDEVYILRNHAVTTFSPSGLLQPIRSNNVFRPVTFASFALNWAIGGGPRPWGYHLFNLLLHALVTLQLYLLLRILLEAVPRSELVAFVSALVFAVHPIHTEAVASIVGRAELLAAGFLLLAWLLHLYDRQAPALVCLVLALASKESAVIFLPLVVAGDYARGKLKPLLRYVSIVGVTSLYLAVFWKIKGGRFGERIVAFLDNPLASLPARLRILNALRIAWKYIGLHVYPANLSSDYSYNAIRLYADWRHAVPAVVATVFVLGLLVWAVWTRRTAWFLAGAIYLGGFSVTANILVPTGTLMGERLAYVPSAGFCLLVALIWVQLENRQTKMAWTVMAVLLSVLAVRTVVRNRDWRDNFSLFSADVLTVPGSSRAHSNVGDGYMRRGELAAARTEFQTALRIYPDFPDAIENYALVESRLGHDQEARRLFEKALSLTAKDALDYDSMQVNLAAQYMKLGQDQDALNLLDQVLHERAGCAPAWSNRAVIHYRRGDTATARSDAEAALRVDPGNAQARSVLSALLASTTVRSK